MMQNLFLIISFILGIVLGFQLCIYAISIAIEKLSQHEESGIKFNTDENTITVHMDKMTKNHLSKIMLNK